MAGLVPAIHVFLIAGNSWMAGTAPGHDELCDAFGVEVGAAVAEEAPFGAVALDLAKIEARYEHPLLLVAEARDKLAGVIGDEGMSVVALRGTVVLLHAQ